VSLKRISTFTVPDFSRYALGYQQFSLTQRIFIRHGCLGARRSVMAQVLPVSMRELKISRLRLALL
jgi:hypothetical protein